MSPRMFCGGLVESHDDDKITSSVSGAEKILCKQGYESHIQFRQLHLDM